MTRTLTILAAAALLALPVAQAEARSTRAQVKTQLAQSNPAIKARQNAMNDFSARMSRLDALMGVPGTTSVRSRSAEAGR
jgi:Ni/Co efflux regulator RcnB